MSCECIKQIEKQLKVTYGEGKFTNAVYAMNFRTQQTRIIPPSLEFGYYPKKKDGTPSKRIEKIPVAGSYCTFCGKKYNRE